MCQPGRPSPHGLFQAGSPSDANAQRAAALASRDAYQRALTAVKGGQITTEIADATEFYYAEAYHQQYLAKNPWGYCGLGGTGVRFVESQSHAT